MCWIVYLRGINVNGVKMTMKELSEVFKRAGFNDVSTVLATGNVILKGEKASQMTAKEVKREAETLLSQAFGYEANVLVYTLEETQAILEEIKGIERSSDKHLYSLLCQEAEVAKNLQAAYEALATSGEQLFTLGRTVIWQVPKQQTLESPFGKKVLGSRVFKPLVTSRNIQTLEKIVAKATI